MHGAAIHAQDGELGSVDEFLFDDEQWTVRYMVVDTGSWLFGRKVLIAPVSLGAVDRDNKILNVNLTRAQVEGSPGVETNAPLSRQFETDFHDYYGWPYYWGGVGYSGGYSGSMMYPSGLFATAAGDIQAAQQTAAEQARDQLAARNKADVHLRSTKEVTGYEILASDGSLGHVDDFIADDETWRICYLAVDTQAWWFGKKVLLPPGWIKEATWPDRTVTVVATRDQVRNGPEWDSRTPISAAFQDRLAGYYDRQHITEPDSPASATRNVKGTQRTNENDNE